MLLVIFGAGASYDSQFAFRPWPWVENVRAAGEWVASDREVYRLPLANDLFASQQLHLQIRSNHPVVQPIVAEVVGRQDGETVEEVLERLALEAESNPRRAPQLLAARYYLRDLIAEYQRQWIGKRHAETNFQALVDQLEGARGPGGERAALVTFNYDRLLELALEKEGQAFRSIDDYVGRDRYQVFKLHGSIDWVRRVKTRGDDDRGASGQVLRDLMIKGAGSLSTEGPIHVDGEPGALRAEDIFIPAIAVPLRRKSHFECPPAHVEALRALLPRVRMLLTIGWSASDEHVFTDLLTPGLQNLDLLTVVGADATDSARVAAKILERLSTPPRAGRMLGEGGFSGFVRQRTLHGFVRRANEVAAQRGSDSH